MIGRIPGPHGQNKFILIAIDHFTKWIETQILETKDGRSTAKAIEKLIINRHGIPKRILTDNGLEFHNVHISDLIKKYDIQWDYSSPGHHETVGAVERANQTLIGKLKKLTDFGRKSWENELENATLAVNISLNRSIQTSPFLMMKGFQPEFDIDRRHNVGKIFIPRQQSFQRKEKVFLKYSSKHIEKGKRIAKADFKLGDSVLIYKETLSDRWKAAWIPGFKIVEKVSNDAFIVTNNESKLRLNKKHIKLDKSIVRGEMS